MDKISGASFNLTSMPRNRTIILSVSEKDFSDNPGNSYSISRDKNRVYLSATDETGVLYAVYDFLSQLGCRWTAPAFDFYNGTNEYIPRSNTLVYTHSENNPQTPSFKYRKLYIEEGLSHNSSNLAQLVEWMPKARFNILVAPMNYQGHGKVQWDNWRELLSPELKKRGIKVEVGGHGYQNFLNASMESGTLFSKYPEWFGMNKEEERSPDKKWVCCTSNSSAVAYVHNNILAYLKARPEIDIFDFWPPDVEEWCHCTDCTALGSASTRHALFVNQTARFLKKYLPHVKLECLAYSHYTAPPDSVMLDPDILVDFCPIKQNFDYQIYEPEAENNRFYNNHLKAWRDDFKGEISLYSYYRRYAWRSLPNILTTYMQKDLKYYKKIGVNGVSVYSEPGDWFTYGINHYVLSGLAWDPDVNVDSLVQLYCATVYGAAAKTAIAAYRELEETVRFACFVPYSVPKQQSFYESYFNRLMLYRDKLNKATKAFEPGSIEKEHLNRLQLMFQYALRSIRRQQFTVAGEDQKAKEEIGKIREIAIVGSREGVFIPR
ncbi:MAG TPA: DUF4838 domain-containing protein [Niabella sp.]|nr:DUF4838 domain-containing protein [Niabella sp.]